MSHVLGSDDFTEERDSTASTLGTSLVVWQFFQLVNGEVQVHRPWNDFETVKVICEERYCNGCFGVRRHDVWYGKTRGALGKDFVMGRCRCCGEEVRYG